MHQLGYKNLWGNEINKPINASEHIHWISGTFNDVDLEEMEFDLITLFHVFEHLSNPKEIIEKLYQALNKSGILILSIPNINSNQANKYQEHWLHLDPPRHLHLIPPTQLKDMLLNQGFELVSEKYPSFFFSPFGYLQSWLNKRIKQRDLLYEGMKKGSKVRKPLLPLIGSYVFAIVSFPFYVIKDKLESTSGRSGTVELILRKK